MENKMKLKPVNLDTILEKSESVYEAAMISAKRARRLIDETKLEYNTLINQIIINPEDDLEEKHNPEQFKISLQFENRPKPHLEALRELIEGKLLFKYRDDKVKL
ncbi:MAG: DNA-directed RNA polymerase subunit omega [Ignavibacteriales bacterium]|nr:DNA-directed RNA polymerase subunit omega [Ignavibacteriales bacterium]